MTAASLPSPIQSGEINLVDAVGRDGRIEPNDSLLVVNLGIAPAAIVGESERVRREDRTILVDDVDWRQVKHLTPQFWPNAMRTLS